MQIYVVKGSENKSEEWKVVKPKRAAKKIVKIGSSENSRDQIGVKKAWLHLGKLKEGTSTEDVE